MRPKAKLILSLKGTVSSATYLLPPTTCKNSTIRSRRNFRKLVLTSGSAIWEVQKAIARSWPLFADATPQNESPDAEEGKE